MSYREVEKVLKTDHSLQELCHAIEVCGEDEDLLLKLLRDVFSYSELTRASKRWAAACSILQGKTQIQTAKELHLSTKIVNQMAKWTIGHEATGGVKIAYERLYHQSDEPPSSQ